MMQIQALHLSTHEVSSPLPKELAQRTLMPFGAACHHCLIASPNLLHIKDKIAPRDGHTA